MCKMVQGILFDLGETLLNFGAVNVRELFKTGGRLAHTYLTDLGKPVPPFERYHRQQRRAIRWNYLKSLFTRREFNSMELMLNYSRDLDHELTEEQGAELAWLWYRPLSECAGIDEGVHEMLATFRDEGLKLGLISNTFLPPAVLDRHLEREGLLELLPVRVYSCQTGHRKPHPKIFAAAFERAGLPAANTMFVGDLPPTDVRGANRAGCISVLKDPGDVHVGSSIQPRHRIGKLTELIEIVAQYNGTP